MPLPMSNPEQELQRIMGAEAERKRLEHYRSMATPETAAMLAQYGSQMPWMNGKAAMALASSGLPPDAPVAQEAGRRAAVKKVSGFKSFVGTVVGAPLRQAMKVAAPVADKFSDIIKPISRAGFTVLSAPLEEIQGLARAGIYGVSTGDFAEGFSRAGGSTLRLALGDMAEGKRVELGSGFFAGHKEGQLGAEQQQLARRLKINGEWISIGRTLADTVFDPGDTGYKLMSGIVDGAIAIGADPTNLALGGLSNVRRMNKLIAPGVTGAEAFAQGVRKTGFVGRGVAAMMEPGIAARADRAMIDANAGMVAGRSKGVVAQRAEAFLDNPELSKLYERWGKADVGFQEIWEESGRNMPVQLAHMLGQAENADEARALIRRATLDPIPADGIVLREKKQLGVAGAQDTGVLGKFSDQMARWDIQKRNHINKSAPRLFRQMPGNNIDIKDFDKHPWKLSQAVEKLDAFQRMMKFDPDQIAVNNAKLASIRDPGEAFELVVNDIIGDQSRGILVRNGVTPKGARTVTKLWRDYHRDIMRYGVDAMGENMIVPGINIGKNGVPTVHPGLLTEALTGMIPLPNTRALRRMTAAPWIRTATELPGYTGAVEALDFMMFQLWRPMTLLRGAWTTKVIGEEQFRMEASGLDAPLFHPMQAIARVVAKGKEDADWLGTPLDEIVEFKAAMNTTRNLLEDPGRITARGSVTYGREDPEFARSWVAELAELNVDELARRVAQEGPEFVKSWIRATPDGQALREKYRRILQNPIFDTNVGMDDYIDQYVLPRITAKTGGNPDLLEIVKTGRWNGKRLVDVDDEQGIWRGVSSEAVADAERMVEEVLTNPSHHLSAAIPQRVKGTLTVDAGPHGSAIKGMWDRVTNTGFTYLMTKPSNYLSRSVAWRQYYWESGAELIGRMTPEAQQGILARIDNAKGVPKDLQKRVKDAARRSSGDMELKDADMLAKAEAMAKTKALLYDISTKGQFADVTRHIFPFAEAWKEVMSRWAKIGFEHPEAARRGQQVIQGARGAGFFQTDPETGEESFIYPGSQAVMQAFSGTPFPLTASVSGLNIFSQSVLPGFGPVAQIAANKLLPNKPEWDDVRSMISPYGDPTEQEGLLMGLAPAWAKRLKKAFSDPESDRLFGNTVIDVQNYLYSTGEFDTSTPEGRQDLEEEAIARSRLIYMARGVAMLGGAPSSPRAQAMALDKNGDLHVQRLIFDDLREMQNKDFNGAVQQFMEKYGDEALMFLQPKTYAVVPGAPTTDKGLDWVRENPDLVREFPNTYGFFAPSDGKFDYTAYLRTIRTGEREALKPDEVLALAHDKYASMIYYNFKNKLGPSISEEQRAALRLLKVTLEKKFPGFGTAKTGLPQRAEPEQQIQELRQAVENPQLGNTQAAQALKVYFEAREAANAQAGQLGLKGFGRGRDAAQIRAAMRQLADVLGHKSPQFALMFDRVLEREMDDDEGEFGGRAEQASAAVEQLINR